jgi:hypothetical protein
LQRPENLGQCFLCGGFDDLIAKKQHLVLIQQGAQGTGEFSVNTVAQIDGL